MGWVCRREVAWQEGGSMALPDLLGEKERRLLVKVDRLQIISHVLLVERILLAAHLRRGGMRWDMGWGGFG